MSAASLLHHCSAIITGASSGLGEEFARQLAPRARALLLVARREEELARVKADLLASSPRLIVHTCASDITTEAGRNRVVAMIEAFNLKSNVLINNAGMGDYGSFASSDATKMHGLINLNVTALLLLTHQVLPLLIANGPAAILNVSSLAGQVPMPDVAVYAASKAFVTSFSEALRVELADQGIVVSALCPGPTPTNFSKTARRGDGPDTNRSGQGLLRIPPDTVVRCGLEALEQNRACVFPGTGVRLAAWLFRVMPRGLMRAILRRRHRAS